MTGAIIRKMVSDAFKDHSQKTHITGIGNSDNFGIRYILTDNIGIFIHFPK